MEVPPKPSIAREPGDHKVTFTVTIAQAILAVGNESPLIESSKKGRKLAIYEAPKAQNYFHLEYKLLPDDLEPVKTDVVMYGVAAKIYNENDTKVLKTWKEEDKIWIAWTQSVSMLVTKEFLLKLFTHTMELHLWDSKEKVSARARFDRPKAFRLPIGKENEEDDANTNANVKALVVKQSHSFMQLQPKDSSEVIADGDHAHRQAQTSSGNGSNNLERPIESSTDGNAVSPAPSTSGSRKNELAKVQVKVIDGELSQWNRVANLAGLSQPLTESELMMLSEKNGKKPDMSQGEGGIKKLNVDELDKGAAGKSKRRASKKEQNLSVLAAFSRVHGMATIELQLSLLFAGAKSITNRLDGPVDGLEDLLVTVSLDKPLLSEEQKKELNPMVIKVCSVSGLPNKPLSYDELQEKCVPVYAEYQFYKHAVHRTLGRQHGRNVYWDDINVVLLGTLDQGCLEEFLHGPPLQVEIHDRDRKMDSRRMKADLFGVNADDEMINNVSLIAGRRTTHNPFESKYNAWDPYGIAKLDLSELLLGQRYLYLSVPVHSCSSPDPTVGHERPGGSVIGQAGSVDGPEEEPLPSANYLEAGSELKVKIEVVHPLTTASKVQQRIREPSMVEVPSECPFARVVYIFDYNNTQFLKDLQNEVTEINARALELMTLSAHVIEAALSTYKLSEEQKLSKNLDIVTGFQIIDGARHIFILEGLRDEGIKQLLERLPLDPNNDIGSVKALYKSDMTFSERLYASLDVDLCRVRLHDSLTNITQKPLLYVRDIIPRPCFEGLTRLDKILNATKLREVVKNDLFPTPEMIVSISREFGVPLAAEDFGESERGDSFAYLEGSGLEEYPPKIKTSRKWSALQVKNPEYVESLKNRENVNRDFVMENILQTQTRNPKEKPETVRVDGTELQNHTAHNYSTQTLNSTELSKKKLREILRKDPEGSVFTYCPEYNAASVVVEDVEGKKKCEEMKEKEKWPTSKGFVVPGFKSAHESNHHSRKPGVARVDELRKPWRENVLHANILKPTVDRITFPWKYRDKDMDVIKQPADPEYVGIIQLSGDARTQEMREAHEKERREWKSRIAVDDVRFRTHRCLPSTELMDKGRKASNPLAKLEDILKDPPKKYSLKRRELKLNKIPALSTVTGGSSVHGSSVREDIEERGGYNPGPFEERSWLKEENRIPMRNDGLEPLKGGAKGKDFRLVFREKTTTCSRPIEPLLPQEKDNHLFAGGDSLS